MDPDSLTHHYLQLELDKIQRQPEAGFTTTRPNPMDARSGALSTREVS